MLSTCPSCNTQVEHEDHLFEVACTKCQTRFNPFLTGVDLPPLDGVMEPAATPMQTPMLDMNDVGAGGSEAASGNFAESDALFAELRDFGEGLSDRKPGTPAATPAAPAAAARPAARSEVTLVGGSNAPTGVPIVAGMQLPGYQIESFFPPVSVYAAVESGTSNPLGPHFAALWSQAQELGASAILGVHWTLSGDGTRVLMAGTPVLCAKG